LLQQPSIRSEIALLSGLGADFTAGAFRDRLISDAKVRRSVNAFFHPKILAEIRGRSSQFVEIPLLIETALQNQFAAVWVVTCGASEQFVRLLNRTGDEALTKRLLALQLPTAAKLPFADVIVRTNVSRRRVKAYTLEAATLAEKTWVAKHAK
jgi:dephospho-CoA kinase